MGCALSAARPLTPSRPAPPSPQPSHGAARRLPGAVVRQGRRGGGAGGANGRPAPLSPPRAPLRWHGNARWGGGGERSRLAPSPRRAGAGAALRAPQAGVRRWSGQRSSAARRAQRPKSGQKAAKKRLGVPPSRSARKGAEWETPLQRPVVEEGCLPGRHGASRPVSGNGVVRLPPPPPNRAKMRHKRDPEPVAIYWGLISRPDEDQVCPSWKAL